jgi:hypothetical protein
MKEKEDGNLFNELLKLYPGDLSQISNPNWRTSLKNQKGIRRVYSRQKLKGYLPLSVANRKKLISKQTFQTEEILGQDFQQFRESEHINVNEIPKKALKSFYWQVFTLFKALETSN